jgi:hypothetical protein
MKEIPECYKIADYPASTDFVNKVKTTKVNSELSTDSLGYNTSAMYFRIPLEAEYLETFITDVPERFAAIREEAHAEAVKMINSVFPNYTMVRGGLLALGQTALQNKHQDPRVFHRFCKRVHWPIVTNSLAKLCVGDNKYHLPENTVWTFNNIHDLHYSENRGTTTRFHIIVDILPTDRLKFILGHITGNDFYDHWRSWSKRQDHALMTVLGIQEENQIPDLSAVIVA